ncbi:MAG: TAXI family TRAP transporter solute-binding subunit [Pseudomonadota bacterium]
MKDALKIFGPLAVLVLIALVVTMRLISPPPPMTLTFAAGGADGQYYALAQRYAEALKVHGIEVTVLETDGTGENYQLLTTGEADVALLQGGVANLDLRTQVQSLGGVFPEPFWIFVRDETEAYDFGDLSKFTVAAGPIGSGTRAMATRIMLEWGGNYIDFSPLTGSAAAQALWAGEVDVAVFTASVNASYVQDLLRMRGVRLIEMRRANGLAMRDPALAPVTLFEGVVELDRGVPASDLSLVAAIAQLGVRADLHPALQAVLLEAAEPIHSAATMITAAGTFPDANKIDLDLSPEARRYYRRGPTFLRRYFSFGWANFLERAWVFLIPLITLLIPLVQMAPPVYRWRIRRRIYVWYNDLHELERRGFDAADDAARQQVLSEIQALQYEVGQVDIPVSYNDELYHLRSHISFVEALIARQAAKTRPA